MTHPLYLASQSPRRAALIRLLGVKDIHIQPSDIVETMELDRNPAENVSRLAEHKAQHVADMLRARGVSHGVVVGADTTVHLAGNMLEKPLDEADAVRMLMSLSGNTHTVYTGVSLVDLATNRTQTFFEATDVTFRTLGLEEVRAYVATGSPMDKAGAYGIQEDFGAVFVRHIDGDYYNVVGLPVCRLYVELKRFSPDVFR